MLEFLLYQDGGLHLSIVSSNNYWLFDFPDVGLLEFAWGPLFWLSIRNRWPILSRDRFSILRWIPSIRSSLHTLNMLIPVLSISIILFHSIRCTCKFLLRHSAGCWFHCWSKFWCYCQVERLIQSMLLRLSLVSFSWLSSSSAVTTNDGFLNNSCLCFRSTFRSQ